VIAFGIPYVFHPDGVIVVQCKRYGVDNAIGRPTIQQFKGVIEEQRAYRGYFVTTSRFTDEATESASKSDCIVLVDGNELIRWHETGSRQKLRFSLGPRRDFEGDLSTPCNEFVVRPPNSRRPFEMNVDKESLDYVAHLDDTSRLLYWPRTLWIREPVCPGVLSP
jgi:hypothetical protein